MSGLFVDVAGIRGGMELEANFAAPRGGITALLGPSGSGKTSLLRMIAGLDRPRHGRIVLGDAVLFDAYSNIDMAVPLRAAGFVFQEYALFPHMTAAENIGYGIARRHRSAAVSMWLSRMELSECARRYPRQLSGGQRQRVALARTLAARPRLLLLDEPLSAVDVALRRHLHGVLRAAVAELECPTLMVSHDLAEIRKLARHVAVMKSGKLIGCGLTTTMFSTPPTRQVAEVLGWGVDLDPVANDELRCSACGARRIDQSGETALRHDTCSVVSEGL